MTGTYPRWVWADGPPFTDSLRIEHTRDGFVDYVRVDGMWRQKTRPMTAAESVTPEKCRLHDDWRSWSRDWPAVDAELGKWLDETYDEIGATR